MRIGSMILTLACMASFPAVACSNKQNQDPSHLRRRWRKYLKDGYERSNFDMIRSSDPSIGTVEGYRVWQGKYRGIPIALYSCSYRKPWGGDLGWISIVLAVEKTGIPLDNPNYSGPPVARAVVREIAEHKYSPLEIDIESILRNPRRRNSWQIGQVRVEVKDRGNSRLGFKINASKKPTWASFDIEKLLKNEDMTGPKEIKPTAFKKYTPQEFAKAMISILKTLRVTAEPWWRSSPTSSEMVRLDHPMWEDPSAMKTLLTTAPMKELVRAINVMNRRRKDSRYLMRLESINSTLLGLAKHKSFEVRGAFGKLLFREYLWPKDVHLLEPLLKSDDIHVLRAVLAAFADRGEVPRDMQRVRELAKSEDSFVRYGVKRVLRLYKSKTHR